MKKRILSVILAASFSLAMAAGCGAPRNESSSLSDSPSQSVSDSQGGSSSGAGEIAVPTSENFDFEEAFSSVGDWTGVQAQNPVFDTENKFVTFREKSNNAVTYTKRGMSTGDIELKLRLRINTDTTAYIAFSNRSADLSSFCYDPGSYTYTLEFSSDGKMYVKKWTDGQESALSGSKASASVPMALATKLTALKISVSETESAVLVKVYADGTLLLDVADDSSPYFGGGAIGLAYTGAGGMAVGSKNSDEASYTAPEALGITIYGQPDKPVATGEVDLLDSFDTVWTGRERIFDVHKDDAGYVFTSKSNPEEPQDGVTEYQAVYADKIFKNVQLEYTYNQVSNGEWTMFWLRCVPESSTNVSVWGNKQTGENTNGYSMLITADGYVQVHKWADGAQIWLNGQGAKLTGQALSALADPKQTISLQTSIEEVSIAGKPTIEIRIKVNGSSVIVVQDSDTPFLNAGYIGLQGYATNNKIDSIRLLSAKATDALTL